MSLPLPSGEAAPLPPAESAKNPFLNSQRRPGEARPQDAYQEPPFPEGQTPLERLERWRDQVYFQCETIRKEGEQLRQWLFETQNKLAKVARLHDSIQDVINELRSEEIQLIDEIEIEGVPNG